jgi:hypothetical protein
MVPDNKLSKLFTEVSKLPDVFDNSEDSAFVSTINSKGLHSVTNIFTQDEALIVALLSLHVGHFHQILNRFKSKKQERKQNRAMAFAPHWMVKIVHERFVRRKILDPNYFKEEFLHYSSVWIDSNTSWMEAGQKRPSEVCGRQGVSLVLLCGFVDHQIKLFTGTFRCKTNC